MVSCCNCCLSPVVRHAWVWCGAPATFGDRSRCRTRYVYSRSRAVVGAIAYRLSKYSIPCKRRSSEKERCSKVQTQHRPSCCTTSCNETFEPCGGNLQRVMCNLTTSNWSRRGLMCLQYSTAEGRRRQPGCDSVLPPHSGCRRRSPLERLPRSESPRHTVSLVASVLKS